MSTVTTPPPPPSTPAEQRPRTPEEIERYWFEHVYAGDRMRQLTPRALLMGMGLGMIMACSNIYVGLKAGWGLGVAITSCILAYSIFAGIHRLFPKQFPAYSILENNAMQSAASAAAALTGAGMVNAIPALLMLNPNALPLDMAHRCLYLIPWIVAICWLGVFLAVPTKRQLINVEQLPFPSGTAAATTLRSLHSKGAGAARQAKSLYLAGLLGAAITWMRDATASWMPQSAPGWMPRWFPVSGFTGIKGPAWLSWIHYPAIRSNWGTNSIPWFHIQRASQGGGFLGFEFAPLKHMNPQTHQLQPVTLSQLTMSFEGSLLFIAAGAIMSFKQAWSMMLGAVINYMILAPIMLSAGVIDTPSFRRISTWSLWTGVPMMVTSGLLLFFMNWRSVIRAFGTITAFFQKRAPGGQADPMERIEVPGSWFIAGFALLGIAIVILGAVLWHIHWWMSVIAVLATFLLVVVAARATGETDITPVGPLSKITQLTFGALAPGNVDTNLLTANISAGATSSAGDLLTDLKSGYLLGANPRQQFFAQFFGVLAGSCIVVPVFFILIPNVNMLATEKWPAPAALVWRGVAELLSKGPESLHPTARIGLVVGALLGILLPLLEMRFPRHKKFIPSPTGLGLAFTINGFNVISMFIGSVLAMWIRHAKPKVAEEFTVPVASGIIAGESLMGVTIAFLTVGKILD